MFFSADASAVTHGIQLSLAPVFLLTAVAAMIGAVTGRLARIIDRARALEERLDARPDAAPSAAVHAELADLRAKLSAAESAALAEREAAQQLRSSHSAVRATVSTCESSLVGAAKTPPPTIAARAAACAPKLTP
jgi:hypothetical protein